jgi:hypothetical protein
LSKCRYEYEPDLTESFPPEIPLDCKVQSTENSEYCIFHDKNYFEGHEQEAANRNIYLRIEIVVVVVWLLKGLIVEVYSFAVFVAQFEIILIIHLHCCISRDLVRMVEKKLVFLYLFPLDRILLLTCFRRSPSLAFNTHVFHFCCHNSISIYGYMLGHMYQEFVSIALTN